MANATEDFMKVMTLGCADTADRKVTSTRTVINWKDLNKFKIVNLRNEARLLIVIKF